LEANRLPAHATCRARSGFGGKAAAMYLKRLSLINFKNIGQEEFPLTPGINCFVGDNGAGKTNFIDAIHYLSMCKSAFSMTDTQSVRHGEEFFLLEGSYERSDGRGEQIVCSFARRGGKTLKREVPAEFMNIDYASFEGQEYTIPGTGMRVKYKTFNLDWDEGELPHEPS
jgi:hypothetical protein